MSYNSSIHTGRTVDSPKVWESIFLEEKLAAKTLFAFGLNHRTAPVEVREKLYLNDGEISEFLDTFKGELAECFILSTCNRTEFYGVSESRNVDPDRYKNLLIDFKEVRGQIGEEHFFTYIACVACEQAFKVATSIDSRMIGDSQILRQLKNAYELARAAGHTGKVLNQLFQRALKLGKQTYTQTSIHDGPVSVSLAAVELASRTFGSLRGRSVMVLGAGEMARLTAEALVNKRVSRILLSNRTRSNAEELLASLPKDFTFDSEVIDFENFKDRLADVDIVISSTGSGEPILQKEDFNGILRKVLILDIAVPRDVDVSAAENPYVDLRNIDDLNVIIDECHGRRLEDLPQVQKMIVKEMVDFLSWYYVLPLLPEYEKTGKRTAPEQATQVLRIKQILSDNVAEIHKTYASAGSNFKEDLASHFDLIGRLHQMKERKLQVPAV